MSLKQLAVIKHLCLVRAPPSSAEESPSADVEQRRGCLEEDLLALLESGEAADVTLRVGRRGGRLAVHRALLLARCPALAAVLRVKGVRPAVFAEVMRFVYTGKAALEADSAGEVLAAAERFSLPELADRCEQLLMEGLSIETAAATAVVAVASCRPALTSAAVELISRHAPQVMGTDGWRAALRDHTEVAVRICCLVSAAAAPAAVSPDISTNPAEDLNWRLLQAAKDGAVEELRVLLAVGADVETKDEYRKTALQWAAERGYAKAVDCLLSSGAEVNTRDRWQLTPLHRAAERGHQDVVTVLLEAGADKSAMDNRGRTPLYIAKVINRWQVMDILK
ncbi:ankyrin repeat domain-containing protein 65-like [Schistocerca piceifrons]|uniref:ankyrin repeat domain-containing protein 65-like n=1 Tax=Schistocerca piceifrons TaxID=274613 RepID=UPI001F5FEBDF|nr:ankyrin repeat domain-containing protein 65-like [Schistocerca piceifrons]